MCCHPVPHSCMEKIYMSTCRNLLLLPPLCRYTGCHVPVGADWRQHLHISINISIARKWHIRMRAAIRRMRARRACRPVTIYGKEEEKRRKRPKADRRSEFSQALLSFTKNIVCPKLCSERNRLFSSSQKTCFAQSFAQKETGPSFAQSRPPGWIHPGFSASNSFLDALSFLSSAKRRSSGKVSPALLTETDVSCDGPMPLTGYLSRAVILIDSDDRDMASASWRRREGSKEVLTTRKRGRNRERRGT